MIWWYLCYTLETQTHLQQLNIKLHDCQHFYVVFAGLDDHSQQVDFITTFHLVHYFLSKDYAIFKHSRILKSNDDIPWLKRYLTQFANRFVRLYLWGRSWLHQVYQRNKNKDVLVDEALIYVIICFNQWTAVLYNPCLAPENMNGYYMA